MESGNVSSITILLLIIALSIQITRFIKKEKKLPFPPGPKPLPILGNLFDVPKDPQWIGFAALLKQYGESQITVSLRQIGRAHV